jgi:branched-chain amino acid transport system permease protein
VRAGAVAGGGAAEQLDQPAHQGQADAQAALAAIAGALYAFYLGFINVESFMLDTSVLLMAMVIIGGTGTLLGPIVGTMLLMLLPSLFSYMWFLPPTEIGAIQQIAYGAAMVLLMIFRPSGLVGSSKNTGAK